jgi:hypothetical protein
MTIFILLIPSVAFAWGPLTHMYLGNELLSLCSILPAGILEILRRYRKDFLYGNLMADIIIGKNYLPNDKNSHSWDVAFDLFKSARTRQQKAFVYGYMTHLAADTVAHNVYTVDRKNFGHTVMEMKADSIIHKKYWLQAVAIEKKVQARNDYFLENALERCVFSFKTNKRIFRGILFFSVLNQERVGNFLDRNLVTSFPAKKTLENLHQESLDKMIDLLQNGDNAEVVNVNPCGAVYKGKILKTFLGPK